MKLKLLISSCTVFFSFFLFSQNRNDYKYWNPALDSLLVLEGQAWPLELKNYYNRLPARAEKLIRKPIWDLSENSAGLQLRFASNASEIIVRYVVAGNLQMPHMPATGVSGVDLYARNDDGSWLWAAGKFTFGDTVIYRFTNLTPEKREYTLYLPLYNTVKWMEIGVPVKNLFEPLVARKEKPIVVYGTSIAQGACASRPGLAWTNILGRRLNIPIINLGFSGNGRLDNELIDLLSEIDAKIYVLDCMPNMTSGYMSTEELKRRIAYAVNKLQIKKPNTPILITEHDGYTDGAINSVLQKEYLNVNKALRETIDSLVNSPSESVFQKQVYRNKNIFLLSKDEIGQDIDAMVDGTHPNDLGMMRYANAYEKMINTISKKQKYTNIANPSLIPLPQQIAWKNEKFTLHNCKLIVIRNNALQNAAKQLQLQQNGLSAKIVNTAKASETFIELVLSEINVSPYPEEAYQLSVSKKRISLTANTVHGIFNGLKTLEQLTGDDGMVSCCEIIDWPAFTWRGFMIDVGRNYQSVRQLKKQIDVMAAYKLNVFHLHLTEDIAWRLQSKKYPQLTDPVYMNRNAGKYYSLNEMKELIRYCKERYITLVPEIDMPGHSAAFKRAMGCDMQSDSGVAICKDILTEMCNELDISYIHVGGDEVKISNKGFLPQMIALLTSLNKKVIAWNPGGNVPEGTMLQMWNGNSLVKEKFPAIDSRHLYLNHFDPIDGVVATFNHQICDVSSGSENRLGATLCNWPDRRVEKEEDLIKMNAVYPVMITFAERCWQGGGWKNYLSDISVPGTERYNLFEEFEHRLLEHKKNFFKGIPFPYVKQTDIKWKLIGPFDNQGITERVFTPEFIPFIDTMKYHIVYGGTIWLRHFWHPMIQSHLSIPEDSSTYYAIRKIWSDDEGDKDFWIGFNNLSRSTASNSPPAGEWDDRHSAVWVNGKLIQPPHWKHGGQKGNAEFPLTDEGYEYRKPTKIFLHKGWNTVMLKCPVGSFIGKDWQNPVKWMFSFMQIQSE